MADRRMFSKKIINSARFMKMPVDTQLLYFHLGLNADDDGVVEAYSIMRFTGISEDNLKILVAKRFLIILNEDLVSFITDWKEHNLIRADRKTDSIYKSLLLKIVPDVELLESKERADAKKKCMDVQRTDNGQPKDCVGKVRIGEVMKGEDNIYIPYKEIIDFLNEQLLTNYKPSTKKTRTLIKARADEGFTFEDFKEVIVKKKAAWQGTEYEKYLRPETLFGNKFEGYLNEKEQKTWGWDDGSTKSNNKKNGTKGYRPTQEDWENEPDTL